MSAETVCVEWIGDQEFLLKDHFGFPILMSHPMGVNGADLLPLSVIGCAAWDIASILKKQRQQLTALQVTAESEREESPPWRFKKIHILYRISGKNLKKESIQKAIELTEQKYCSIFATVKNAVEISSSFEIWRDDDNPEEVKMAEAAHSDLSDEDSILQPVIRFNDALNARDGDTMMRLLAESCVFENTYPAPDGTRYEGRSSVRAFWEEFFHGSRQSRIETEEIFACGDRCVMRWIYHWLDAEGRPGHVRGVDVYRVRDGLILEKLSYVKG